MTDDLNNPLLHQIAAKENAEKAARGEQHWNSAVKGKEKEMRRDDPNHTIGSDPLSQAGLVQQITRPDDNGRLFNDGISMANEEDWRRWRDSLPDRKRWRARTGD